jgi:uncharacterized membrane protein HdeD (DUF308 family)
VQAQRTSAGQPTVPPQAGRPGPDQPGGGAPDEGMARGTSERPGDTRMSDARTGGAGPDGAGPGAGRVAAAIAGMAWTAALLAAVGMIAVGVLLLAWPTATLTVVAILIGAALIVAGLLRLFDGATASAESGGMRAADIVIGVLAVIAGLYCIKHHSLTVVVLALVVGIIWVIHGIGDLIVAATAGRVPGRGLKALGGLVSLAAGLVILFWPGLSLILLLTILGAWLIFYGVVLAVLAFRLRRDVKASTRPAQMAPA